MGQEQPPAAEVLGQLLVLREIEAVPKASRRFSRRGGGSRVTTAMADASSDCGGCAKGLVRAERTSAGDEASELLHDGVEAVLDNQGTPASRLTFPLAAGTF
jgi:hypothetical protein